VSEGCKVGRANCLDQIKDILNGANLLNSPEAIAALGPELAKELYERQIRDLTQALNALQSGMNTAEQRKQIALIGAGLLGTALGGWAVTAITRTVAAACSTGWAAPSCFAVFTDLSFALTGMVEGVPMMGAFPALGATAVAARLANAGRISEAELANELRLLRAEVTSAQASSSNNGLTNITVRDRSTGQVATIDVDLNVTFRRIANGDNFPHRNEGSVYRNDPPLLPAQPYGYYSEYVVAPPSLPGFRSPGTQRVLIGASGEIYYTPDHYSTFIRIR
jgi:guanyl-specific ribonuclease Sa